MAFVPAPNILLIEVRATKELQRIENRFHVDCLHPPTLADIIAVNAILATSIATDWVPNLPTDVTINSIFYRSLETENDIQLEVPLTSGNVGTFSGTPAPNQNTICISLRSGSAGRSARGRLYWLGLSEGQYTTNVIDSGPLADIVTVITDLVAALAAASYPWTIVSYQSGGAPRPGGPVYFFVTNVLTVDAVIDSQRRRMPGHGT